MGHYSTIGNITGVIDWGKTQTYTAGLRTDYKNITDDTIKQNISSLITSANNNSYIDTFPSVTWSSIKNIAACNRMVCWRIGCLYIRRQSNSFI